MRHASRGGGIVPLVAQRIGITANALGVVCIVIALVKRGDATVEGAYFDRSEGDPASAFAVSQPNIVPWLIAALVLVAVGTALLLLRRG